MDGRKNAKACNWTPRECESQAYLSSPTRRAGRQSVTSVAIRTAGYIDGVWDGVGVCNGDVAYGDASASR